MTVLEFIAAAFGVISVWYSRKNNILVYPTGLLSVMLYVYICYKAALYADAALNVYYTAMSILGWYNWSRKRDKDYVFPVSYCDLREWIYGLLIFIGLLTILYLFLANYTNSNVPWGDSLVSASSATAMWWMARRKIESWYAWLLADAIAIPLFYSKHLYFTVMQFAIFLILAAWGLIHWIRLEQADRKKNISNA